MPANTTSMLYNEENGPPWHRKGTPVRGLATAAECIRKAGLDWAVAKIPVRVADDGGLPIPGAWVTIRTDFPSTDRRRILGLVGEEYRPLQNWEAFDFFDAVVDRGAAIYETAGVIENGKRIWLLAKLPGVLQPVSGDRVEPYLLLANGHDGKLMVHVKFTPVRVVCQNTLAMALTGSGQGVAIRHNRSLRRNMEDAARLMGLIQTTVEAAQQLWENMAQVRLAEADAQRYFQSVFGGKADDDDDEDGEDEIAESQRPLMGLKSEAMKNFRGDQNQKMQIAGTVWAAYNAAVWAIDWARESGKDRVDDLCLNQGALVKQRALARAEALVRGPSRA